MNISDQQLEQILHHAPCPRPPAGLKEKLISQAPSSQARAQTGSDFRNPRSGWLRRWWPVLVPGIGSMACAVVFTVQQLEITKLKQSIQNLTTVAAAREQSPQFVSAAWPRVAEQNDSSSREQLEFERLRKLARELQAEIAQLEQLRGENEKLRRRLSVPLISGLSAAEAEAAEQAREKAMSINCINNLKQFGLSVRTWSLDENGAQPPNVICMSNELSTPKILVCPADTSRQAAADWSAFTPANCSYEYLVLSGTNTATTEPTRVMSRCPIHGHVGLCDGSVVSIAKDHSDWLVTRNGKLYYEPQASPGPPSTSP